MLYTILNKAKKKKKKLRRINGIWLQIRDGVIF